MLVNILTKIKGSKPPRGLGN